MPSGRGMYIWRLNNCEGGDIDKIIAKCTECAISWLAIKAGDQGRVWAQFNKDLVDKLHNVGIKVYGWSYDVPTKIDAQVKVIEKVYKDGADGYLSDSEVEWNNSCKPTAKLFTAKARSVVPADFVLGNCPWDVKNFHANFPYDELPTDLVTPQAYFVAHGISVKETWDRYVKSWGGVNVIKNHFPGGSVWGKVKPSEVEEFETLAKQAGCSGVLYWVWDNCPRDIWTWFKHNRWLDWNS